MIAPLRDSAGTSGRTRPARTAAFLRAADHFPIAVESAARIVDALRPYPRLVGRTGEWLEVCTAGLAAALPCPDAFGEALAVGERAYAVARERGYLVLEGRAAEQLGELRTRPGRLDDAHRWYGEALRTYEVCDHSPGRDRVRRTLVPAAR